MNNLIKGFILGGVSAYLADVIYKKGVAKGYKQGKEVGKTLGEIDALVKGFKR